MTGQPPIPRVAAAYRQAAGGPRELLAKRARTHRTRLLVIVHDMC